MHKLQIMAKQLCLVPKARNAGSNYFTCLENLVFIGKWQCIDLYFEKI